MTVVSDHLGASWPPTWFNRFTDKIDFGEEFDDCHLWRGAVDAHGYGKFRLPSGPVKGVHIIAWELAHGREVPAGWHVDHLCRIRLCCNADHLEAKPQSDNTAEGRSPTAVNKLKTHCPKNHKYTEENTRWHSGRRECRICVNARDKERRAAKRADDADNDLSAYVMEDYLGEWDDEF